MTKADKKRVETIARACGWEPIEWDREVAVVMEEDGDWVAFAPEAHWGDLMRAVEVMLVSYTVHRWHIAKKWSVSVGRNENPSYHRSLHRAAFLAVAEAAATILGTCHR